MNIFDNLVLPQSAEHIQLINYLLIAIFFLFIPYIGILFVSSLLSFVYRSKGIREGNTLYKNFAALIIRIPTLNKSIGVILGIVPFLTITFMISQIMHRTETFVPQFLLTSFILGTIGVILIYTYRYSQDLEWFYVKIKNRLPGDETDEELEKTSSGSSKLAGKSGLWGLIALTAALWFFISSTTMVLNPSLWKVDSIYVLSSWKVMIYFLQFLALASALTGAALLFIYYYWEGGKEIPDGAVSTLLQKVSLHLMFWGTISLPLLMLGSLFSLDVSFLSGGIFVFSALALVIILVLYNLIYGIFKDKNYKLGGLTFFLVLFTALSLIIKDQMAMRNATEKQAVILNSEFQKYLTELRGDRGVVAVNGKEIFDVRCSSCHRFDQKLVGPAYNDVLPKYEGKADQLVGFILNPGKINPQYPPMPNPGLKPNEAKAVAEYILETYKK